MPKLATIERRFTAIELMVVLAASLAIRCQAPLAAEPATGPKDASPGSNDVIRRELIQMANDDQADTPNIRGKNQARLEEIIVEYGWPGKTLVGLEGARAAWLIAQHADFDLTFQKRCLEKVQAAALMGEVEPQALAYLTDRVLVNQHKPQEYGTQGVGATSPEDEARIDSNRKTLGLEPWRTFVENRQKLAASGRQFTAPWEAP